MSQVNGHAAHVLLDNGPSESFMSIAYEDQLGMTWSAEEAVIRLRDNKIGVAQGVCRVGIHIGSCTTRWTVRIMKLLAEYDLVLREDRCWCRRLRLGTQMIEIIQ